MVTMEKINCLDGLVYMRCYVEGKKDNFFDLCVDPARQKIISNSKNETDIYVRQAAFRIYNLYNDGEVIPENECACWC